MKDRNDTLFSAMSRFGRVRAVYACILIAAAAAFASCGAKTGSDLERARQKISGEETLFDWTAYKGTQILVLTSDHPWVRYAERRLSEFTALTGITVSFEIYPEDQFRVKRTLEMLSGITNTDAFMNMPGNSIAEYAANGWVEPLDQFINDEKLLSPELDLGDFYARAMDSGIRNGAHYSVPLLLETSIIAYNKKIFARYGVQVPTTMKELETAARTIYEKSGGKVYGITMRGLGSAATSQWVDFLHSFGGSWLNKEGASSIDSPEGIESLAFYGHLLRDYGPRDATRNGWYESLSVFMRGEAGMIYDGNVFRSHYEDPAKSLVYADVGYAMLPAGPAGSVPHISNWGLSIYPGSKKKKAAWLFIQWAASKEMSLGAHQEGIPSARKSVWKDSRIVGRDPSPDWTEASTRSYEAATYQWNPPVINVDDAREVIGEAITAAILGRDIEKAARNASSEMNAIIATEYWDLSNREH